MDTDEISDVFNCLPGVVMYRINGLLTPEQVLLKNFNEDKK